MKVRAKEPSAGRKVINHVCYLSTLPVNRKRKGHRLPQVGNWHAKGARQMVAEVKLLPKPAPLPLSPCLAQYACVYSHIMLRVCA